MHIRVSKLATDRERINACIGGFFGVGRVEASKQLANALRMQSRVNGDACSRAVRQHV